jgi:hypothetical protein
MGKNVAVGTITYPVGPNDNDHAIGRLIVIKLGLTNADAYANLCSYRTNSDPLFPAHSTFRYVAFAPERLPAIVTPYSRR